MKITRYMGAFAVIAMLAACSTDDELGANSAANEVKIAATVGGNSIFTRSNPVGTEEEQTSFNEGDAISVTTEGTTVIYKKTAEVWAPVNAAEFLLWTGNAQTFQACYPEKADENSTKNSFSAGWSRSDFAEWAPRRPPTTASWWRTPVSHATADALRRSARTIR